MENRDSREMIRKEKGEKKKFVDRECWRGRGRQMPGCDGEVQDGGVVGGCAAVVGEPIRPGVVMVVVLVVVVEGGSEGP